jgi:hypothetical protein
MPFRVVLLVSEGRRAGRMRPFGSTGASSQVRFIAETPQRTRVELEHRDLQRHGDGWEGVREGVRGDEGWPLYLERFAVLVNG